MDDTLERWLTEAGDYAAFDQCIDQGGRSREGYWSPFVTLAWVATRNEEFLAGAQLFERRNHASRGGHSWPAWLVASNRAGALYGWTFTMAIEELREALEAGRVFGVFAHRRNGGQILVERQHWTGWNVAHETWGVELIPGLVNFEFPSDAIRAEFPEFQRKRLDPSTVDSPEPDQPAHPASPEEGEHWTKRQPTRQQRQVIQFFADAAKVGSLPGGERGMTATGLRPLYAARCLVDKQKDDEAPDPFAREAFERWLRRYVDGWRPDSQHKRWHRLPQ